MPVRILMPALSPTMLEGNLIKWNKKEGDNVKSGDILAEIETDKATMEVESIDDGVLSKILIQAPQEKVKINSILGILLEKHETEEDLKKELKKLQSVPAEAQKNLKAKSENRLISSPLARRIAHNENIDLSHLHGTGPKGRIIAADVYDTLSQRQVKNQEEVVVKEECRIPLQDELFTDLPFSSMRQIIAERLSYSKQTIPHFYLTIDIFLDKLILLRHQINEKNKNIKISLNDFFIKASSLALERLPEMNVCFYGTGKDAVMRQYKTVDISVAVSVPDGLYTPIIFNANQKSISRISKEIKELAQKAKSNKLKPFEYQGGNFSVSNLGMFGIKEFSAIINPPQSAILSVGALRQEPVVLNGQVEVAHVMTCTLSVDHRVVDGVLAAKFLNSLKEFIESPLNILL
jgi:pyruvate dehydrogenase E2 component (dihydrolipoamide acetyltransferase)